MGYPGKVKSPIISNHFAKCEHKVELSAALSVIYYLKGQSEVVSKHQNRPPVVPFEMTKFGYGNDKIGNAGVYGKFEVNSVCHNQLYHIRFVTALNRDALLGGFLDTCSLHIFLLCSLGFFYPWSLFILSGWQFCPQCLVSDENFLVMSGGGITPFIGPANDYPKY